MQTLRGWRAVRSGANIRVTGYNTTTQEEAKIQASVIEPRRGGLVVATTKDGTEFGLVE